MGEVTISTNSHSKVLLDADTHCRAFGFPPPIGPLSSLISYACSGQNIALLRTAPYRTAFFVWSQLHQPSFLTQFFACSFCLSHPDVQSHKDVHCENSSFLMQSPEQGGFPQCEIAACKSWKYCLFD